MRRPRGLSPLVPLLCFLINGNADLTDYYFCKFRVQREILLPVLSPTIYVKFAEHFFFGESTVEGAVFEYGTE